MTKVNNQKHKKFNVDVTDGYLLPHIIFNSCHEVLVEGSKGVLEYNPARVKLNAGSLILNFTGGDLSIRALSVDEIIIKGNIASFEFCSV